MAISPNSPKQSGFINPFKDVDYGALWRKARGDSSADVIKKWDNVSPSMLGYASGTDATMPGGSKSDFSVSDIKTSYGTAPVDLPAPFIKTPSVDTGTTDTAAAAAAAQRQAALNAQADPLRKALSALDSTLADRKAENAQLYNRNRSEYNEAFSRDQARYNEEVSKNEQGFETNRQNRLYEGGQLANRLRAILGSMGALNGTGSFLSNQAVQDITNRSLGEGRDTFNTTATTLSNDWGEAEREHRQRLEDAEKIRAAQDAEAEADVLTKRQQIMNQLGTLFGADTAEGARYLGDAGALYSQIAKTARPNVGQYQKASSLFSPSAIAEYLGTIGDTTVQTSMGNNTRTPINSPLFTTNNRRREERLA